MSHKVHPILLAIIFGVLLPGLIMSICEKIYWLHTDEESTQPTQMQESIADEDMVSVLMKDGSVQLIEISDYLVSVLLREMPARFELEALKAQAVVARTYTLRRCKEGNSHHDADVCVDSSCCQAYWDIDEYISAGGNPADLDKIRQAVSETNNEVVTYDGSLIDATYFSCSGGMTEDAVAVWGNEVPYLRSVVSPGEESAKHYVDTVTFTRDDFMQKLDIPSEMKSITIDEIDYTSGGGVNTMKVCGVTLKGTTIRKKLGLNSTAILISVIGDMVTITTRGKGHRVGMSQYGADAMARNGANYKEIVSHYYCNTQIVRYVPD